MNLKMKLTASISAFFLVVGLMLIGIMAVNQATVNMGGSISFTATDVYARVTGKIENAQGEYANKELPTLEFSAENDTPDQSGWSNLNLLFDDDATPIVIKVTVENLSAQNTLRVNLNDTLSSTVGNLEKVVKRDGQEYANQTDITLQPNGQENDSTTFTITMSVTNKNNSVTANFDYELNLFDQYYVEPQIYDYFTFKENGDGTVELTDFDEKKAPSTDIVIPESVSLVDDVWMDGDDYIVTAIADGQVGGGWTSGVFKGSNTTSITLPQTLIRIGDYAFEDCSGLTGALDLSNCTSLTSIGEWAFYGCSGLASITLPSSLISIGDSAFGGCTGLKGALDLSNCTSLISIGNYAFDSCSGLASITLPSSLISIGDSAFGGCTGLTGTLDLSNYTSLTSIGEHAFNGCSGLTSITLPSSLTSIGDSAFSGCSGLKEVDLSNCTSLTSIGEQAFYNCSGLTGELNLGECTSLTSIGNSAFWGCSGLTSITLPSSLEAIGDYAFRACTNLQPSETDSQGVKYLGNSENPYLVLWDGTDITTSTYTVNEKCKIIYNTAFEGCSGLTSITLPSSLTSIGYSAFGGCSGLTEVDLSNCTSLTSIGSSAFSGCSGLTSITFPSSLKSIESEAFEDCSGLTEVDLSNCTSLTSIGSYAFQNCSNLERIVFPNTTGWYATTSSSATSGAPMDMSDPEQNADWLTSTYLNYYFKRNA